MAHNKEYQTYIERRPSSRQAYYYNSHTSRRENISAARKDETEYREEFIRDEESRAEAKRRFISKKRRNRKIKHFIFYFFMLVAVVVGNIAARLELKVTSVLNKMNRQESMDLSVVNVDENLLASDKKIFNILLVGSDKRASWNESGRSDSTMIATLDLKNKKLKLTSLMRDMYVTIPQHGENRFNAAYSFGGVSLLYQTIAQNFNIKLDGYVIVDFEAFKSVINTLGGVEIELTQEEYKYLTTAYKKGTVLKLQPGVNNMNGTQALAYTRIRQDAKGDFGRTERQRRVLQEIFKEVKAMPMSQLIALAEELMPYIATDLTNEEIFSYLKSIIMLGTTQIDQMRIPVDDSFTQDRIHNMAVLIPDMDVNRRALHNFIFESDETEE